MPRIAGCCALKDNQISKYRKAYSSQVAPSQQADIREHGARLKRKFSLAVMLKI